MQFITNRISTGKAKRFEDFIDDYKKANQIKTAATEEVKVAEQEEADSSGQLDVEPLHQEGESTTMPKNGPSAKTEGKENEKGSSVDTDAEKDGDDSGQPKAEGSEKFTNDPKAPSKEEKGGEAEAEVKVAEKCEKCDGDPCECEGTCDCKPCTANREAKVKEAALEDLPQEVQDKIKGKSSDDSDDSDDSDEEKESEAKEEKKEEKESSEKIEFVKFANLDGKNKAFLTKYWRQLFGDDYVNALVADK